MYNFKKTNGHFFGQLLGLNADFIHFTKCTELLEHVAQASKTVKCGEKKCKNHLGATLEIVHYIVVYYSVLVNDLKFCDNWTHFLKHRSGNFDH